jgi:hypothetical protein
MIGEGHDTLFNDPAEIEDTFYMWLGNDSLLVPANCNVYRFDNRQLVLQSTETVTGKKVVNRSLYYKRDIDDDEIDALKKRCKKSDTVILGNVEAYDKDGRVVKRVFVGPDDTRQLSITRYDAQGRIKTRWWREYYNKKYDPDSLTNTSVRRVEFDYIPGWFGPAIRTYINDKLTESDSATKTGPKVSEWTYTSDRHRNWVKMENDHPRCVRYRKIVYKKE